MTSSKFPTDSYAQALLKDPFINIPISNITPENIEKEIASLYVYFDELKYIMTDQIPKMETANLISSIGGNLGLFLGLSICSFMELFELICLLVKNSRKNKISGDFYQQ